MKTELLFRYNTQSGTGPYDCELISNKNQKYLRLQLGLGYRKAVCQAQDILWSKGLYLKLETAIASSEGDIYFEVGKVNTIPTKRICMCLLILTVIFFLIGCTSISMEVVWHH
jgi:hypothetical protein